MIMASKDTVCISGVEGAMWLLIFLLGACFLALQQSEIVTWNRLPRISDSLLLIALRSWQEIPLSQSPQGRHTILAYHHQGKRRGPLLTSEYCKLVLKIFCTESRKQLTARNERDEIDASTTLERVCLWGNIENQRNVSKRCL